LKIWSNTITTINKIKIFPGEQNIDIDHKDPKTAAQLRVLRRMGAIVFRELLDGDIARAKTNNGPTGETPETEGEDICPRDVQKSKEDEGPRSVKVPKRRNGDDNGKPVRGTRRKKKPTVDE